MAPSQQQRSLLLFCMSSHEFTILGSKAQVCQETLEGVLITARSPKFAHASDLGWLVACVQPA